MTYIQQAKTPTLIQHGEFERRVPIPNAFERYQGLKDRDVPVRLVVCKASATASRNPTNSALMQHNLDWFSKWIWGEETGAHPAQTAGERRE